MYIYIYILDDDGGPSGAPMGDFLENFDFFGFFDFSYAAPVLGVLDIVLLIPEVW